MLSRPFFVIATKSISGQGAGSSKGVVTVTDLVASTAPVYFSVTVRVTRYDVLSSAKSLSYVPGDNVWPGVSVAIVPTE